jgi:hypothetical protein
MAESNTPGEPVTAGRCPWCSSPLDDTSVPTCPHCGAALKAQHEGDVPGVTQIDALSLATQRRDRGGGVRALIGMADEETQGSPIRSVPEPPSDDVRREILRLRVTALEAEIEAQSAAIAAAKAAAAASAPGAASRDAAEDASTDGSSPEMEPDGGPSEAAAAPPEPPDDEPPPAGISA